MPVLLLRAPSPQAAVGTAPLCARCTGRTEQGAAWAPGWSHHVHPGSLVRGPACNPSLTCAPSIGNIGKGGPSLSCGCSSSRP